ncbi:7772_t:CDS:2, partial [Gigaspora rosea]
ASFDNDSLEELPLKMMNASRREVLMLHHQKLWKIIKFRSYDNLEEVWIKITIINGLEPIRDKNPISKNFSTSTYELYVKDETKEE